MLTPGLVAGILLILVSTWFMGGVLSRLGLPVVMAGLLAGVVLGPPGLGFITPSAPLELMAEFGILLVMFHTGLEMDPRELLEHIWPSMAVAIGGFVLPFALGYFTTRAFGGTLYQSLFVGMAISITAIAVQSVILHAMKINQTTIGHIIIGAAIADDILSLIGLSVLLGLAKTGSVQFQAVSVVVLKVVAFFAFTILLGHFVLPRFTQRLHDREGKAFTFGMVAALFMAYVAELAGLHLIIGAFLAGQFVRKEIMDPEIFNAITDRFYGLSYGFLVPVFFVSLSFHLTFHLEWGFILFALAITLAAAAGKVVGCGMGLYPFRRNLQESAIVGFGMNGRGAVELVVASVVINLSNEMMASGQIAEPLLTEPQFSALVLMAFITTMAAPLTLRWAVNRACSADEHAAFCRLWDERRDLRRAVKP